MSRGELECEPKEDEVQIKSDVWLSVCDVVDDDVMCNVV